MQETSGVLSILKLRENTTLTGGVVVFSLPFRCSSRERGQQATSHPGWMFNPAHRLSNQQQFLIVFGRCTTGTSKQTMTKPPKTYLSARSRFSRCDAVRCDAMRCAAMQCKAMHLYGQCIATSTGYFMLCLVSTTLEIK